MPSLFIDGEWTSPRVRRDAATSSTRRDATVVHRGRRRRRRRRPAADRGRATAPSTRPTGRGARSASASRCSTGPPDLTRARPRQGRPGRDAQHRQGAAREPLGRRRRHRASSATTRASSTRRPAGSSRRRAQDARREDRLRAGRGLRADRAVELPAPADVSWKVAPALAAGNTIGHEAGLSHAADGDPPDPAASRRPARRRASSTSSSGPGERVGQALADSPDVDLHLADRRPRGRAARSMRGAAGNLKKVALEMGGKSPNIVFADADFETAVDNALTAAFTHSGQVCSAGCRAIVEDAIHDRFVEELGRRADRIRLGHGPRRRDRGRRADHRRAPRRRSRRYVAGRDRRGRPPRGRRPPARRAGAPGRLLLPADRASPTCARRHDGSSARRSSGRSLTIERFSTEEEADRARQRHDVRPRRRGLDDRRRAGPSASRRALRHGTVWINDYNTYLPQAEWGGFKQSGHRPRAGPDRPRRVPRGEAHLAEHAARARAAGSPATRLAATAGGVALRPLNRGRSHVRANLGAVRGRVKSTLGAVMETRRGLVAADRWHCRDTGASASLTRTARRHPRRRARAAWWLPSAPRVAPSRGAVP